MKTLIFLAILLGATTTASADDKCVQFAGEWAVSQAEVTQKLDDLFMSVLAKELTEMPTAHWPGWVAFKTCKIENIPTIARLAIENCSKGWNWPLAIAKAETTVMDACKTW